MCSMLARHARLYAGHPRLSFLDCSKQDVDGRDKPGHDVERTSFHMSVGVAHQLRKMISATMRYTGSSVRVMIPVAASAVSAKAK
jgi:hypothetical protein